MISDNPLISIIILNYNGEKLIEDCINSVIRTNYQKYEIILVDNNSQDNSHKICKEKFPDIILIENKTNLGYCEGNNIGIKKANGKFIVILNPDTIVEPDWLKILINAYHKNGEGLYQPKLLAIDDKNRINTSGNMINVFGFGFSRDKGMQDVKQSNQIEKIGYASGACLFTSRNVLDKTGLFDSFLFAYHDDLDLGWRAAQQEINSYYVPNSIVYHAESFSFKWSHKKFFLLERNRWYCLLTHYSKKTLMKILPSLIIIEIIVFFYYLSQGMIKEKIRGYSNLLKNSSLIHQKYLELESKKTISDSKLIRRFQNKIETPKQVASSLNSNFFNSLLEFLSKLVKLVM